MMVVWFLFGLVCGVAVGMAVRPTRKREVTATQANKEPTSAHKEWVQTRNFLYYDGTEMPVIKEEA